MRQMEAKMAKKKENVPAKAVESLFNKVSNLIEQARVRVATAMNVAEVYTKYQIGRLIVEDEQKGQYRAEYGKQILLNLSERLISRYEGGWTVDTLKRCRFFYRIYCPQQIGATVLPQSEVLPEFTLSWSHYLVLMRIKNADERRFYEIEATSGNWSFRELQRQYGSSLYERLALSRDKEQVARLARVGNVVEKPEDIIKNPVTLMRRIQNQNWNLQSLISCKSSYLNWERGSCSKRVRSVSLLTRTTTMWTWSCTIVCCSAMCSLT